MYACSLNKLHNACNKHVASVTYCINLNLFTLDIVVYENRLILIDFNGSSKVVTKLLLITYKLHCTASENEAWTYENRISYFLSNLYAVLYLCNCTSLWLWNVQVLKNLFECITVFCSFDSITVCTNDFNSARCQRSCEVNCSLSTKRCNNSLRLFKLNNTHYILYCKRLEIKLIRCCIVG